MASNYVDLYRNVDNDTMTEQEGLELHGRDGVFCTSPLYTDIPLLTESQSVAEAINELKKGLDEGGGGESWSPPEEWPEIPEPSDYEVYLLVSADDFMSSTNQARFALVDPVDCAIGNGPVTIDWGDGNVETWADGEWTSDFLHTYDTYGLYIVKIIATETSCLFGVNTSYLRSNWLLAKLGNEIVVGNGNENNYRAFSSQYRLQYVKMSGKNGLCQYCFSGCNALKKVDIAYPPVSIPRYAFYDCRCLKRVDFSATEAVETEGIRQAGFTNLDMPVCTRIETYGVRQCLNLISINAPQCTAVGDYGIGDNYALQTYKFADGCTFGSNVFASCYSLYPYRKT